MDLTLVMLTEKLTQADFREIFSINMLGLLHHHIMKPDVQQENATESASAGFRNEAEV